VSRVAATSMIESSRVGAALRAAELPADALLDAIVRIGQLAADQADIDEIDINPLIVSSEGAVATDARVTIHATRRSELPLRRLA
jgi:acetyltransferase